MYVLIAVVFSILKCAVESRTIGCVLESVPGTRNQFTVQVSTTGQSKVFYCANGTVFDQQACVCVNNMDPNMRPTAPPIRRSTRTPLDPLASTSRPLCRPRLVLNFNSTPIRDFSNNGVYVSNEGVGSVVSAGQFNKQGRIHIPMFSWIGHRMTITLRFFEWDGGDPEQTLIANCYHPVAGSNGRGSFELMLRTEAKEVVFRVNTTQSVMREIVIPYLAKRWNNVTATYNGRYFKARVNNREGTVQVRGNIESRAEGMYIGQCPRSAPGGSKRAYVGYIDDLNFYQCVQPNIPSRELLIDRNPV
ncbi:asparagine-rich protein-like isoform X2 [Ostrea edulis]|uniref:asparagine-rich protein-like isoform X2 n=1 Tax=Ostrea edulis TaxID=37623 RepID=UPI0020949BD8|nr:asparagine-rich protein-like isoform X2 [Ostrea edulis]